MESEVQLGVATMFRDATMQSVVPELRTPADWDRFNDIRDRAAERERQETETFQREKPNLLAEARQELIDEAGSKTLEHPTPFNTDRFSKAAIDRQA